MYMDIAKIKSWLNEDITIPNIIKKDKPSENKKKIIKPVKRKISKEEIKFKEKFNEVMFELDLYNKFKKTYKLDIKSETNYGYYAHLYLESGLSFNMLDEKREVIEQNLQCIWAMKFQPFRSYAEVQIVLRPVDESVEFENYNIKPNEFYLGLSFANKLQKINADENHMFLLAGATGSGKTRYIYQVLLSWIMGCSPDEVWLYLADIIKNEYIQFQNVKHVKYYASDLEELYKMMGLVDKEMRRRNKIITSYREKGLATNIYEYNKINKSNKLAYCYVMIDEFSVIQPNAADNKEEKEMKKYILAVIGQFAKVGRSLGMFLFTATQKPVKEEMPPIIKNMSGVRICFKVNDDVSSRVIMENNSAVGLPNRVAVYSLDGGTNVDYLYSPKLITEDKELQKMLEPYMREDKLSQNKLKLNESDDVTIVKTKTTRIPKGVNAREYIKFLREKEKLSNEGDYNDY